MRRVIAILLSVLYLLWGGALPSASAEETPSISSNIEINCELPSLHGEMYGIYELKQKEDDRYFKQCADNVLGIDWSVLEEGGFCIDEQSREYSYVQRYYVNFGNEDDRLYMDSLGTIQFDTEEARAILTVTGSGSNQMQGWSCNDFSFMSRSDAGEAAAEYLMTNFGIDAKVKDVFSFTKQAYDELYQNKREWIEQDLAEGSPQGSVAHVDWSNEELCYKVILVPQIETLAIYNSTEYSAEAIVDVEIEMLLFSDGVKYIRYCGRFAELSDENKEELIPVADAIEVLRKQKANVLGTIIVDQIRLEYLISSDGAIMPCWIFVSSGKDMMVNGVSGEWMGELRR